MMSEWLAAEGLPAIDMFLEVTARRSVLLARYNVRTKRNVENRDFLNCGIISIWTLVDM